MVYVCSLIEEHVMKKLLCGMMGLLVSTYVHAIPPKEVLENDLKDYPKALSVGIQAIEDETYAPKWHDFDLTNEAERQQAVKLKQAFSGYLNARLSELAKAELGLSGLDKDLMRSLTSSLTLPTSDVYLPAVQYGFFLRRQEELRNMKLD
jgi:hypothetical protein